MALVGLQYGKFNSINYTNKKYDAFIEGQTIPDAVGKLIDASFAPENATAELYADDGLAESSAQFLKGTLTLTVDNVTEATVAKLFDHDFTTSTLTKKDTDEPIEVGYAQVVPKIVNGVQVFKAEFLPRVKFTSIKNDASTKGESVEFKTVSLEAKVMKLNEAINGNAEGTYYISKEFDTLSAARSQVDTWLTATT